MKKIKKYGSPMETKNASAHLKERFVSEPIRPIVNDADLSGLTIGEPVLPKRFLWRNQEYSIVEVLEKWKQTGPCKSGSEEKYLRRHWFKVKTADGKEMTIYFERQPRSRQNHKLRWWLYSVTPGSR